jgi:hypothetical protein
LSNGEAAKWHAPLIGLDAPTVDAANLRRSYKVQPVDADALAEQQRIANAFSRCGPPARLCRGERTGVPPRKPRPSNPAAPEFRLKQPECGHR